MNGVDEHFCLGPTILVMGVAMGYVIELEIVVLWRSLKTTIDELTCICCCLS